MVAIDPSGDYDVSEVTVTVAGVPLTKGAGAKGAYVCIGQNGTHFRTTTGSDGSVVRSRINDLKRPLTLTLLRSSPSNAVLREMQQKAKVGIRVERHRSGEVVLETDGWVEQGPPRNIGSNECLWSLTVMS
jgi:hypothetical protein